MHGRCARSGDRDPAAVAGPSARDWTEQQQPYAGRVGGPEGELEKKNQEIAAREIDAQLLEVAGPDPPPRPLALLHLPLWVEAAPAFLLQVDAARDDDDDDDDDDDESRR